MVGLGNIFIFISVRESARRKFDDKLSDGIFSIIKKRSNKFILMA